MNRSKQDLLFYLPRVTILDRKKENVKPRWWIRYYLPVGNETMRVRRPAGDDIRVVKANAKIKESELCRGIFDKFDRERMGVIPGFRTPIHDGVEKYIDKGMASHSGNAREAIIPSIRNLFRYFEHVCKRKYLNEITEDDFLRLRTDMEQGNGFRKPLKRITINDYQRWIATAFNWFVKQGYLEVNPILAIKKLRLDDSEKSGAVVIPLDDVIKIVNAPEPKGIGYDIKAIVLFMLGTAMRRREVLHLQWSDIDDLGQSIEIKTKNDCPTRYGLRFEPKWGKGGEVYINWLVRAALNRIEKYSAVWASYTVGTRKLETTTDFVFARSEKERYVRINDIRKGWRALLRNAGIRSNYRIKDLRSTANNWLQTHYGFNTTEASQLLRHSPEVNLSNYTVRQNAVLKQKLLKSVPPGLELLHKVIVEGENIIN